MPHQLDVDFYSWRTEVFRNEMLASMNSELYVYFEIPELRSSSFDHEIWADRFLGPRWKLFYESNKKAAQERLRRQRKLVSSNANPHDYIEQQIAGYFHQNIQWAEVWRSLSAGISEHMHSYVTGETTPSEHKSWLESHGVYDIPFFQEAKAFSEHYHNNRAIFGNHKLSNRKVLI